MPPSAGDIERMERALKRAIIKRDKVISQMRLLYNLAKSIDNNVEEIPIFCARRKDIDLLMSDFRLEQDTIIEQLVDLGRESEFNSTHSLVETNFTEQYYFIQSVVVKSDVESLRAPMINSGSHIQLPKIQLPQFNGDILNWRSFRDTFTSLVHNNTNLSNIERFHYLIASVSGTANAVVRSVPMTDTNYVVAWKSLHDRFDNPRLIVHAHLDKLFGFAPLVEESLEGLKSFLNTFQENIAAIDALEIPDVAGFLFFYVASRMLDSTTKCLFEAQHNDLALPVLEDLITFVQSRCQVLQNSTCSTPSSNVKGWKPKSVIPQKLSFTKSSFVVACTNNMQKCPMCSGSHFIYKCDRFKALSPGQCYKFIKSKGMCTNCLSSDHTVSHCVSKYVCRKCSEKHHSLLHFDSRDKQAPSIMNKREVNPNPPAANDTTSLCTSQFVGTACSTNLTVLSTAIIRIQNRFGNWIPVRALIDSGSQISAISHTCAVKLGLSRRQCHTSVVGLSQSTIPITKGSALCTFVPRQATTPEITCQPIILSNITGLIPSSLLDPNIRASYQDLDLADPTFDRPGSIEFLVGADIYNQLFISSYKVRHVSGLPSAFETSLGWILSGKSSPSSTSFTCSTSLSLLLTSNPSMEQLLRQFWEIEHPPSPSAPFTEDNQCEELFCKTTVRDITGRYSVSLPFRKDPSLLGDSRASALSRFYNLERRLQREPDLHKEYCLFMREYEELNHMRLAASPGKYIIPHHAVVKRNGETLKLRVVFDASAKTSSGYSLNDLLFAGPKLQCDITNLLLRCRLTRFMFTADICKMFRQISINEEHLGYQHILWRESLADPLLEYELLTVTYGVSASPFQAIRVLHQLEQDRGLSFPAARQVLSSQTYVDDIISGADSVDDVLCRQDHVVRLLLEAGFILKKWASNCPEVLARVPLEDRTTTLSFDPKDDASIKILGLHWDPCSDTFTYHTNNLVSSYTKRSVLSCIAKLFDPIGALAPITFWAKWFMQSLWKTGCAWDDPIGGELSTRWHAFASQLPSLTAIKIHRYIPIDPIDEVQILGFCDASTKGYGAVVYFRVVSKSGNITIHFVTAKSKVAPLKTGHVDESLTIPRLELCGALLLAQTLHRVKQAVASDVKFSATYAWTDSTVTLSWLTAPQVSFKIFVTNRLAKIKELIPICQWRYVPSELNPADCVSRGLFPKEIINNDLYWNGPAFIKDPIYQWNDTNFHSMPFSQLPELKPVQETSLLITDIIIEEEWLKRFSSFTKLQRTMVYMNRFIKLTRKRHSYAGYLRSTELAEALLLSVRHTQRLHFEKLFRDLTMPDSGHSMSRALARLSPYIDPQGIIRVGGRLRHSNEDVEFRNPILLPKACSLTELLIRHYHLKYLHGGPQVIASALVRRFWIISGRSAIRLMVFKCIVCTRHRANHPQPIMADLPTCRVRPSRPFSNVGVDYAGPFQLKEGRRKTARSIKCYLSIFVCMAIKAVHIEVVSELSTKGFIAALHRFVSRRGIPEHIYSDCGTNFQGASRELKELFAAPSAQNIFSDSIPCQWHFNPPAAPHFGGLWEAAVKSTKHHLARVVGTQTLSFEEMCTLSSRIEATLNSRPITPMSSDPHDFTPLTPGHFLIGAPLLALPEPDYTTTQVTRLRRWELLSQMLQSFWKRWSLEYLSALQSRSKWIKREENIAIGDLVLIHSHNSPPISWKMGRVDELHPGIDGVVRVVTVRTADSIYKHPVVKLT